MSKGNQPNNTPTARSIQTAPDALGKAPSEHRAFFERDTMEVARDLLGFSLISDVGGTLSSGIIVEVEAYKDVGDLASHSAIGQTDRNRPMFLPGGHAYVYRIYGLHFCFNVVTEPAGVGCAVLIRAIHPQDGLDVMRERRSQSHTAATSSSADSTRHESPAATHPLTRGESAVPALPAEDPTQPKRTLRSQSLGPSRLLPHQLCSGPGKLCVALGITDAHQGLDLLSPVSPIRLEPSQRFTDAQIEQAPRIGITRSAELNWRLYVRDSRFVSR